MGEHRRGDAADRNEAQDEEREYLHFQVQIDGIHHSRSTSRRKTVREARVRTAAIVERDARLRGGCPPVQRFLGVKETPHSRPRAMSGVVLLRAGVSAPPLAKPGRAARLYIFQQPASP
jgi:hypothetical protein